MADQPYRVTVNMGGVRVGDKVMIDPFNPNLQGLLDGPNAKLVPWVDPTSTEPLFVGPVTLTATAALEAAGEPGEVPADDPSPEAPEELLEAPGASELDERDGD